MVPPLLGRPLASVASGPPARGIAATLVALALAAAIIGVGPRLADAAISWTGITDAATGEALFTVAVFGPLALMGAAGAAATLPKPAVSARTWWRMLGIGTATGLGAFGLAVIYTALAGTLGHGTRTSPSALAILAGTCVVLVQVVAEEMYFRGWVQPMLARGIGMLPAIAATGIAFGLLHALGSATAPVPLLNMIAGGMLFGVLAARGRSVAGAIGAHGAWNLAEQLGVGLDPNPGIGSFGAFADWDLNGAAAWGGSADGLNGSWAMLFALLATTVTVSLLPRLGSGGDAERS